jgi:hypothetical protein
LETQNTASRRITVRVLAEGIPNFVALHETFAADERLTAIEFDRCLINQ